jgi:subtilisin family serine protease
MGFPEAWTLIPSGKEVVVAVIDTGVDYTHPDLEGRIWTNPGEIPGNGVDDDSNGYIDDVRGWDLAGTYADSLSDADNDPLDKDGHGTHVAGIAAATTNNGTGIAGLLPRGKLMVLKVQADVTGGARDTMLIADIIAAYAYARTNGARIVNCSFGGAAESTLEHEELTRLKAAGLLVVCAAGNRGSNLDTSTEKIYPACYGRGTASLPALEHILSVASMTALDNLVSTSNYGMASVHLAAPGDNVISTCLGNTYCNTSPAWPG